MSDATNHQFAVDTDAGERLDLIISRRLELSRTQCATLIANGMVQVNGKAEKASYRGEPGDNVTVTVPPPPGRDIVGEQIPLDIVFEDDSLIVVNKAPGMVVHPAAGHSSGTLVNALLHHVKDLSGIGGELRPGIVHRLDRGTSGLMVVAKHDRAHQELSRLFRDREVEKEYVALVWGVVHAGRRIDAAIGRDE